MWKNHDVIHIAANARGELGVSSKAIVCANSDCNELTLSVWVAPIKSVQSTHGRRQVQDTALPVLIRRSLLPEGGARPQPEYIPAAIREDYVESCLIADLSPKASATLARRCLQGMIRDFCAVKPGRLVDEIDALSKALEEGSAPRGVSDDSIEALTAIRHMGNFGAHMEKDVDLVIPVEANEARELIGLIETLFEDWYVERFKRAQRFGRVAAIAAEKKELASSLKAKKVVTETENSLESDPDPLT